MDNGTSANNSKNNITITNGSITNNYNRNSYLPNTNEINKMPKTPVIMKNIKYPSNIPPVISESIDRSIVYDKNKICTSSLWSFYLNGPTEKKSNLLFNALSSELGTIFSNILSFVEVSQNALESSKNKQNGEDNREQYTKSITALFKNDLIDEIFAIIKLWAPIKIIDFIDFIQKENGIDTNKYSWDGLINSSRVLQKYFGILVSNIYKIISMDDSDVRTLIRPEDFSIQKTRIYESCQILLEHCSNYLNTEDRLILMCNTFTTIGNENNDSSNFDSSTDNISIKLMKFPNPTKDETIKVETINMFEIYWGIAMGNEMRARVKELSLPRVVEGRQPPENENGDSGEMGNMFEVITATKPGIEMLKSLMLFFHMQAKDGNDLYYNMLKQTYFAQLNHMKQLYLVSKELLQTNTRRNLYITCVIYSELLYLSRLWFCFATNCIDRKIANKIIADVNTYDMMCIVGNLQDEIGKYVEEYAHKEFDRHFRSISYSKRTKHRQQQLDQQSEQTNAEANKENKNNSNKSDEKTWNHNLVNNLLNDIFCGLNIGIENYNNFYSKTNFLDIGIHFPMYIGKTFAYIVEKILVAFNLYLLSDKTPKYKGKKTMFKIDIYGIKLLLGEIMAFKKETESYIRKLCNKKMTIDYQRWYYIFHLYLEPKATKSNSIIAASVDANLASSSMDDSENWSLHRCTNYTNNVKGDNCSILIQQMKKDLNELLT